MTSVAALSVHVCARPAAMSATSSICAEAAPSCCSSLKPQQVGERPSSGAHACLSPRATGTVKLANVVRLVARGSLKMNEVGTAGRTMAARPSPQQKTSREDSSAAQVCR